MVKKQYYWFDQICCVFLDKRSFNGNQYKNLLYMYICHRKWTDETALESAFVIVFPFLASYRTIS